MDMSKVLTMVKKWFYSKKILKVLNFYGNVSSITKMQGPRLVFNFTYHIITNMCHGRLS